MINKSQVKYVAQLARLELTEEECDKFTSQLGDILDHAEKISALNLEDVKLTTHPQLVTNVFREDKVLDSLSQEDALSNAPDKESGMFKVPRII